MGGQWSSGEASAPHKKIVGTPAFNNNKPDVVVIPIDQSKHSEAAFEWYVQHVHRADNVVRVIHCHELNLPSPYLPDLQGKPSGPRARTLEEQLGKARDVGKSLIDKYEHKLTQYQIRGSVNAEFGYPGEMVVRQAEKFDATMIVMGSRGHGMIRKTILGSVSDYVLHHTAIPVTVVPKEPPHTFF